MSEGLRQRIPWSVRENISSAEAGEEIELFSVAEEGAAETAFVSIEEAAAGLDATGAGAPIGLIIGALAAAGFGAYEIYEHLIKKEHNITYNDVKKHIENSNTNTRTDIVPLEDQTDDIDFVPIENQDIDKAGFVPPPFKYLGPGNSLNRGQPYNEIDAAAKRHDEAYSVAKTKYDIYNADQEFLQESKKHFVAGITGKGTISDTIGATLGGIGIGTKHFVEKAADRVFYPSISGKNATSIKRRIQKVSKLRPRLVRTHI